MLVVKNIAITMFAVREGDAIRLVCKWGVAVPTRTLRFLFQNQALA